MSQPVEPLLPVGYDEHARALSGQDHSDDVKPRRAVVDSVDPITSRATVFMGGSTTPVPDIEYLAHVSLAAGDHCWLLPTVGTGDYVIIGKRSAT